MHNRPEIISILCRLLFLVLVAVPIVWGYSAAFRSNEEIAGMSGFSRYTFVPKVPTLNNFIRLFQKVNVGRIFVFTIFVSVSVTLLNLFINSIAAYSFARIHFIGKKILFSIMIATLAIPIEILIIPLYRQVYVMGMMNSLTSLIVPFCASAFGIFFMRQFFLGIPRELEEAAVIDGCGRFRIFQSVMLPLSKTALITLGVTIFLQQWDSFLVPVTFISSESKMLLQVAINYIYSGLYFNDFGLLFAGMVIASVPIIILFLFLQKYYVAGISSTGIKG
jgi:multiple sugar transport system permease protein